MEKRSKKAGTQKHFKKNAFSLAVCNAVRFHVGESMALEARRKKAFEKRDAAIEELEECDEDSEEAHELKEQHSDAVREIASLDKRIKFHNSQVQELVEKADEPALDFVYEMPEEDDEDKAAKKTNRKADAKQGRIERPDGPRVEELELTAAVKAELIKNGFEQIAQLEDLFDDDELVPEDELEFLKENQVAGVRRALEHWKSKQERKAENAAAEAALP